MTTTQQKLIDKFVEKYGGVKVVEVPGTPIVQLKLEYNMVRTEGITFGWLSEFAKEFYEISIGIPEKENKEFGAHITLFTLDPFN